MWNAISQITGVITLTTTTNVTAADAGRTEMIITQGANLVDPVLAPQEAVNTPTFVVAKSELQLQVVKPPSNYIADIVSQVQEGAKVRNLQKLTSQLEQLDAEQATAVGNNGHSSVQFIEPSRCVVRDGYGRIDEPIGHAE